MQMSLQRLIERYAEEKEILDMGGYEPGLRTRADSQAAIREKHGSELRPGAYKMQLRPEEEAQLELVSLALAFLSFLLASHARLPCRKADHLMCTVTVSSEIAGMKMESTPGVHAACRPSV